MNADAFRHLYDYHFAENRKLWDYITPLSYEQFTQPASYSHGSVRDHLVHIMNVDEGWFSELENVIPSDPLPSPASDDREAIRAHWDTVQQNMRSYLAGLQDSMLLTKPIQEPDEDRDLMVWQVLIHVANHATDHRAQILRSLTDLGINTHSQDYMFHAYAHPVQQSATSGQ